MSIIPQWLKSPLRARYHEARIHIGRVRAREQGPRLVIFPSDTGSGSTNLRAFKVGEGLRAKGWRVTVCHSSLNLEQRRRLLRLEKPDVVLMQKTYHPLNRASLYPGSRIIFDLDDADYLSAFHTEKVIDCCRHSKAVIAGSTAIAQWCRQYGDNVHVVWTGTPISPAPPRLADREPIITWAASHPQAYPADGDFVTEILRRTVARRGKFRFRIYADDGGEDHRLLRERLIATGVELENFPLLDYDDFIQSLSEVVVGLAPLLQTFEYSVGKSFGKVLGYLDQGVPIITQPVVDHPFFFRDGENGLLRVEIDEWVDALEKLIDDQDYAQRLADTARADFIRRLSVDKSVELVDRILREVIAKPA